MTQLLLWPAERLATWFRVLPSTRPARKATKKRSNTKGMVLDLLDAAWLAMAAGRRLVAKAWYCDRLGRGSESARARRWSTFRQALRTFGIAHEQAQDEPGVVLLSPAEAYAKAQSLLPPVGPASDREEQEHERAAMDFGVFCRLGVARVGGWQAVSSGAGRTL